SRTVASEQSGIPPVLTTPMTSGNSAVAHMVTAVSSVSSSWNQSVSRKPPSAQPVPQMVTPQSMSSSAGAKEQRSGQRSAASPAQMLSHAVSQQNGSKSQTACWHSASSQPMPPLATQQLLPPAGALQPPLVSSPHASFS